MSNTNILVEAKNECTHKLCRVIGPVAIESMLTLYNDASELSRGKKILVQYQKLLQEVKSWNESIVADHTKQVTDSCGYFRDLLNAIFISYTKIMSSIRLGGGKKSINIKVPKNSLFIHTVLIELADSLYHDPHFLQEQEPYVIKQEMLARTSNAIESTIKILSPLDEILKTYVTAGDQVYDPEDDDGEESTDPEVESDNEEPQEEEEEMVSGQQQQQQFPEVQEEEEVQEEDDVESNHSEEKTIPMDNEPPVIPSGEQEEEEDLFPSAPE